MDQLTSSNIYIPLEPFRGIKSLRYIDKDIFSGREQKLTKLVDLILLYRGNMVYGQSGIGKSSLIAAGLIPKLLEEGFQPEVIRVSPLKDSTFIINKILTTEDPKTFLPSIFDKVSRDEKISLSIEKFESIILENTSVANTATEIIETAIIEIEEKPTPVLIFDQFEELITYFEEATKKEDSQEVIQQRLQLQHKIISLLNKFYYDKKLNIKLLFIFREDYLPKFSQLINSIPDLRDHYVRIKPIKSNVLEQIISCPFKLSFANPFSSEFINALAKKFEEYFAGDDVSLTEVQIVCLELYRTTNEKDRFAQINQDAAIKKILEKFYEKILNEFSAIEKIVATNILALLVLNDRTRNIYHHDAIINKCIEELAVQKQSKNVTHDICEAVLKKLEEGGFIRKESRKGGVYCEISSETLIPYINKRKIEIEYEKEKYKALRRKRWVAAGCLALLSAFVVLLFFIYKHQRREKIIEQSAGWYNNIPVENIRDASINILDSADEANIEEYKASFEIAAKSFVYKNNTEYDKALYAAILANWYNNNAVTQKVLAMQKDDIKLLAPYKKEEFNTGYYNYIKKIIPGKGGTYFVLFNNNKIIQKNYTDSASETLINYFTSTTNRPTSFYDYNNNTYDEINFLPLIEKNKVLNIFYTANKLIVVDNKGKHIDSLKTDRSIATVVACNCGRDFAIVYHGQYCTYCHFENGNISKTTIPEKNITNLQSQFSFENAAYFVSSEEGSDILYTLSHKTHKLAVKPEYNGTIQAINNKGVILFEEKDHKGYYTLSSLDEQEKEKNRKYINAPLGINLAADSNIIVAKNYGKIYLHHFLKPSAGNEAGIKSDTITNLPDFFTVYLSPKGKKILLQPSFNNKYSSNTFLLYNTESKKLKCLFLNTDNKYANNYYTDKISFLNDSVLMRIKGSKVEFFNLFNDNFSKKAEESLNELNLPSDIYYLFSDQLLKLKKAETNQEFLKVMLTSALQHGDYDSIINISKRAIISLPNAEDKRYHYALIYNSYLYLKDQLPSFPKTVDTISLQIKYLNQMIAYSDTLKQLATDESDKKYYQQKTYSNKGSLSWFLIIRGNLNNSIDDLKQGLKNAKEAVNADTSEAERWINTNVALGYLFLNDTVNAFKVYRKWGSKNAGYYNLQPSFKQDIEDLENYYKISIPYKKEAMKLLR
jgi:hypothetical protein